VQDGFIIGIRGQCPLGSDTRIGDGLFGVAGGGKVVGQQVGDLVPTFRVELFQDSPNRLVEGLTMTAGKGAVGRFLDQGVTEQVRQFRVLLEQADQAQGLQHAQVGFDWLRQGIRPLCSILRRPTPSSQGPNLGEP
jgi:hypothetical protein